MTIPPWSRAQEPLLEPRDDPDAVFAPAPGPARSARGGAALLDALLYDAPLRTGEGASTPAGAGERESRSLTRLPGPVG